MNFAQIKQVATAYGLKVPSVKKDDLVRAIQKQEGNSPCFATGRKHECGQTTCLWLAACE